MNYTGNTDYKNIQDKQFLTVDTNRQQQIISELNKQNIPFSARYDEEKMTVTFSKNEFEKVNEIINSANAPQQKTEEKENVQADKAAELREQLIKLQQEQERLRKELDEQNARQQQEKKLQEKQQEQKQERKAETAEKAVETLLNPMLNTKLDTSKESYSLLPIISAKVEKHQMKVDTLADKKEFLKEKIELRQARIQRLTDKAERLTTTNQMLGELINNRNTPIAIKQTAREAIKVNELRISYIRSNKLPKQEGKLEKQQSKLKVLDKKIDLAQFKINRMTSLNDVIKSFSLPINANRRRQFSAAMDALHNSSINLYNSKIELSTAKIENLTVKHKIYKDPVRKAAVDIKLIKQRIVRLKATRKRNKLVGVIVPYTSQPEKIQDEALKQAENTVNNALKNESVAVAEIADNVVLAPLPLLPKHTIVEPDVKKDIEKLIPEVAMVMDMSVSELESKPQDIKDMLLLEYMNNYDSNIEQIQDCLSGIINPNVEVEKNLDKDRQNKEDLKTQPHEKQSDQKENPLKTLEELVEGNANMIDGIINNEPPKKEDPKHSEVHKITEENKENKGTFTFSRKALNRNAQKISNEHSNKDVKDRNPPNHESI